MSEPRRLSQSGGVSQRLLDSASIDKPSAAARRRAALLAATASSFSTTSSRVAVVAPARSGIVKTLATWIAIGAAASVTLALGASKLLDSSGETSANHGAAPALVELPAAPGATPGPSPDIVAEPKRAVPVPSSAASAEEAMALQIQTLAQSGKTAEARTLAKDFLSKHPSHPLANRVRMFAQ